MCHEESGLEFEAGEQIAAELEDEREQVLETQLRQDERRTKRKLRPLELEDTPGQKKLKRELRREALTRLEDAARTKREFDEVVAWWDRLDENRERRERDHEATRGDLPLEYGADREGMIFPAYLRSPYWQELFSGYFLNIIFDCPYEMHELLMNPMLSKLVFNLKDDHKELLYYKAVRRYSSAELGAVLGQSDRNVRKKWARLIKRLQKNLYELLTMLDKSEKTWTLRECRFIEEYQKSALDDGRDGW